MLAFVFPGQGSQFIGMGREIFKISQTAQEVFEEVDDILNKKLTKIIFEGPEDQLLLTENAQPALMTVSLALIRILEKEAHFNISEKIAYMAGHSLGEYSALASAGALSIAQTARLLHHRGKAMQQAVPLGEGGMIALLGGEKHHIEALIKEVAQNQICEIANDNAPGQIVLSGHQEALQRIKECASQYGIKKTIFLPVSAPFHCSLMKPAAVTMQPILALELFSPLFVPMIANVTAEVETEAETFKTLLVAQITGQVKWRESILKLKSLGVKKIIEVGAGKVLTGLSKRIDPDLETFSLQMPDDIDLFIKNH